MIFQWSSFQNWAHIADECVVGLTYVSTHIFVYIARVWRLSFSPRRIFSNLKPDHENSTVLFFTGHQIAMVTKDKSSTLFIFLTILPLHILLPTYAYFLLITIFGILLLLKYLPKQNILFIATMLSLCLMLNYAFPNFYILFTINVVSLLLLFQQLLPTYTFFKIIQIIVSVLFLRYTLPMYTLLTISTIGLFALLQYDVKLRTSVRCCFSYSFLVLCAAVISFIVLPIAILRPWNIKNLL